VAKFFPALDDIDDGVPQSERIVLHALSKALSDEYYVYHSVSFIEKKQNIKEGEADLIIFHKKQGLLILEVKGGGISIENGQWFSENRSGKYKIKNPFEQARKAKHAMLDKIKKKHSGFVSIGYSVCFPHSKLPAGVSLPMDVLRELVIDSEVLFDFNKCSKVVNKLFSGWNQEQNKITADFIQHHILAPSFRLIPDPKLNFMEMDEKFLQLTQGQYQLLDWLEGQRHALITGSAGTGKTLLLLEKARRLAEQGNSVLILSFNIKLSEYLKAVTKEQPLIHCDYFHGFCGYAATLVKKPFIEPEGEAAVKVFYEKYAPEVLIEAIEEGKVIEYDAVLVDEGQDFYDDWWLPVSSLVKNEGWFYIFYDSKQNLFKRKLDYPITSAPYPLNENCRNTSNICEWLCDINSNAAMPKKGSPVGVKPEINLWTNYEGQLAQVRDCLNELLSQGYLLSDIVILTPYRKENSMLYGLINEKKFTSLMIESIMKFKGLEASVVLVCDLGMNNFSKRPDMLFTGASRAQKQLYVFCHKDYPLIKH